MKKTILFLLVIPMLVLIFAGCSNSNTDSSSTYQKRTGRDYEVIGNVEESISYNYKSDSDGTLQQLGLLSIKVSYDYSGTLTVDDEQNVNGSIDFRKIKAEVEVTPSIITYVSGGYSTTDVTTLFSESTPGYSNQTCTVTGTLNEENELDLKYNCNLKDIVKFNSIGIITVNGKNMVTYPSVLEVKVGGELSKFAKFTFNQNTPQVITSSSFRDDIYITVSNILAAHNTETEDMDIVNTSSKETITIKIIE